MKVLHVFTLAITAEGFFDGQFKYLSSHGLDITLACSPSPTIHEFAKRNSIKYFPVEIARTLSPKKDYKALIKLLQLIRDEQFDVVIGHTPKGGLLSLVSAKILNVKRRIHFRHGLLYTTSNGLKQFMLKKMEQFVSALATNIVNVSPSIGAVAVKDKLNPDSKQIVIGKGTCGGIDTLNAFNPDKIVQEKKDFLRQSLKFNKNDFIIGFCGRLCNDKGISELISGFKIFQKQNPQLSVKLLLVGDYDNRDILPKYIHETINYDKDIIITGYISQDIQYYYSLMDVFVFPSHREGFGMCSIEAQAMKIPVLAAKTHGCVDTIIDGNTGFYVDNTPESICQNISKFYNLSTRFEMGENARKFVCENFERTSLWPLILKYYNSLL